MRPTRGGILQRLLGLLGLGKQQAKDSAAALDRSAFRGRVEGLLQRLQTQPSDTPARLAAAALAGSGTGDAVPRPRRRRRPSRIGRAPGQATGHAAADAAGSEPIRQRRRSTLSLHRDGVARLAGAASRRGRRCAGGSSRGVLEVTREARQPRGSGASSRAARRKSSSFLFGTLASPPWDR